MASHPRDKQRRVGSTPRAKGPCLVMCARAPPQIGGTPTVMYELLRHFPPGAAVLVSKVHSARHSADDRTLDVEHHQIAKLSSLVYHSLFQLVLMPFVVLSALRVVRGMKVRPSSVLAVFPSLDFLAASLLLSKLVRVPVFVYLHDCILETAFNPVERGLARMVERWIFSHAARVYSISEPMRDYLLTRSYGTEVLPHGVDVSLMRAPKQPAGCARVKVGFAGGVYGTNLGALRDLVEAKKRSGGRMEIHVRSPEQSLDTMRVAGLLDSFDSATTVGRREQVLDFLSSCDVLVVPMDFESKLKKDLLTIFPTKVTDYWLAQRPILVYGPDEYSFVVKAARDGYARAVTERDPDAILKALDDICGSPEGARRLVQAARASAVAHDGRAVSRLLMDGLGIS